MDEQLRLVGTDRLKSSSLGVRASILVTMGSQDHTDSIVEGGQQHKPWSSRACLSSRQLRPIYSLTRYLRKGKRIYRVREQELTRPRIILGAVLSLVYTSSE